MILLTFIFAFVTKYRIFIRWVHLYGPISFTIIMSEINRVDSYPRNTHLINSRWQTKLPDNEQQRRSVLPRYQRADLTTRSDSSFLPHSQLRKLNMKWKHCSGGGRWKNDDGEWWWCSSNLCRWWIADAL